jgi:hypothetical protein
MPPESARPVPPRRRLSNPSGRGVPAALVLTPLKAPGVPMEPTLRIQTSRAPTLTEHDRYRAKNYDNKQSKSHRC